MTVHPANERGAKARLRSCFATPTIVGGHAARAIPNVVILTTVNCTFINGNRGCAPTEEETIEAAFTLDPSVYDAEDRFGVVGL